MADYTMDDETWMKNKAKVAKYVATHDVGEMETVINWTLAQGDEQPSQRKKYWSSITTLFSMQDDNPLGRGRQSTLPTEVQDEIEDECNLFQTAHAVLFATEERFSASIRSHGKSGGVEYTDANEYAEAQTKSFKTRLTAYYRNHLRMVNNDTKYNDRAPTWDGSRNENEYLNIVDAANIASEEEE